MRIRLAWLAVVLSVLPAFAGQDAIRWEPLNEPGCGGWLTSIAVDPADGQHVLIGGDMLGLGVSRSGGMKWESAFGLLSYEIANFTFNPHKTNEVWVGTMSGPHLSTDGGVHWEARREGLPPVSGNGYISPVQQVLFDPANDQRLLAFCGSWRGWTSPGECRFGWIWESLDNGRSWHEFSVIKRYRNIRWVAAAAGGLDTIYASVSDKGFFKSSDGGKTWAEVTGLPSKNVNQVATHPTDANVLWVSMDNWQPTEQGPFRPGGIWKSEDAGVSWKPCNTGLPQAANRNKNFASRFGPLTVSASDPKILFTSDMVWDNPAIYRSGDGGDSWQPVFTRATHRVTRTAYPAGLGATVITIDPKDPNTVYCAGSETAIKSTDGGQTWMDMTAEAVDNSAGYAFKGRGYSGLCSIGVRFSAVNPDLTAIVAMDAGRLWISNDRQQTWRYCDHGFPSSWGGGKDVSFSGTDGKILLGAFGQNGREGNVGLSTDGGSTWKMLGQPGSGLPPCGKGTATASYVLPDDADQMWVAYDSALYHSVDRGQHWTKVLDGVGRIFPDPGNPHAFYITGKGGIRKTADGKTFDSLPAGPSAVADLAIDKVNPGVLYATQGYNQGGCVWKFDGKSWTRIFDNPLVSSVTIDPTDGQRIAVSTNRDPFKDVCDATGAWLSEDGGKTWSNQHDGLPVLRGWSIQINPHDPEQIIYGTQGRGFFVAKWPKHIPAK